jgi:hypothetical protein
MRRNASVPSRGLRSLAVAAAILIGGPAAMAAVVATGTKTKHSTGACQDATQDALRSCRSNARASYWLALARCDNAADSDDDSFAANASAAGRSDCGKAARQDQRDALSSCSDQFDARIQICDDLGGGPYDPPIDPANFSTNISNPYDPMKPGTTFVYEGDTLNGHEHDEVHVTNETRTILGVVCVAVQDTSTLDGVLSEDTTDWFAQDTVGNVWYFGEQAKQYSDGVLVGIEGSWMAGVNGAKPGIVVEANPKVGDIYRQEFSIGVAEDIGQVVGLSRSENVPYTGAFTNALETFEFSGLEPDSTEHKFYVPNVGFVLSVDDQTGERAELVSITP